MHLKPTAGCEISALRFGFGGTVYISRKKLPKNDNALCHLGIKPKVLPGPLTDLNA